MFCLPISYPKTKYYSVVVVCEHTLWSAQFELHSK